VRRVWLENGLNLLRRLNGGDGLLLALLRCMRAAFASLAALSLLLLDTGCDDFDLSSRGPRERPSVNGSRRIVVNSSDDHPGGVPAPVGSRRDGGPEPGRFDGGPAGPAAPDSGPPPVTGGEGGSSGSVCGNAFESEVFKLVNKERAGHGLKPFKCDPVAGKVAHDYSQLMCNSGQMGHTVGGTTPFQRMEAAGIDFASAGENVAAGQKTPAQVMQAWMSSSGHRANILGDYLFIGVGYVACSTGGSWGGGHYWTQNFWR
jgi:uncharacterized protein YkwD